MGWWLGQVLAAQAATIALVGIVGLALVSSSSLSLLAINGMGHTRQVAMLHAAELPLYLSLLYLATMDNSLTLLLAAWLVRLLFDALGMELILRSLFKKAAAGRSLDGAKTLFGRSLLAALIGTLLALIFRASYLSPGWLHACAAAGAACALMAMVNFGLRLRHLLSASPTTHTQPT